MIVCTRLVSVAYSLCLPDDQRPHHADTSKVISTWVLSPYCIESNTRNAC